MMKIIYFGTPQFAAHVLEFLIQHHIEVVAIITKPDRPKGRSGQPVPTPVKAIAHLLAPSIPVYQPDVVSTPEFADLLKSFQADLFVVVAYGEILKQFMLDIPPKGCINLHASLLPKYRGAAPIQRCIIHGEVQSGIAIMHMAKKMDAGDIIEMATVPIHENMTAGELEKVLCESGSALLVDVIKKIDQGIAKRTVQNHELATFAPKLELEDCEIHWDKPAQEVHNLIRGVNPEPGAWCYVWVKNERKRLKIVHSRLRLGHSAAPGKILSYGKEGFVIACGGDAVEILDLQLEGKKLVTAKQFVSGLSVNSILFNQDNE